MQVIKYCDSVYSAHLVCGMLANEGIEAQVINENIGSVIPFAIESLKVQVVVADEDTVKAIEILNRSTEGSNNIICPYCDSIDIGYRFSSRSAKYLMPILAILTLFTGGPIGNIRKVSYCKACKQEFSDN